MATPKIASQPIKTKISTTLHWCPKERHSYCCSHLEEESCLGGNGSELNCPEHGGRKRHLMRVRVTPKAAPQLKTVEEIREILHIDTDPFIWETPAWRWQGAESFGAARASEPEDERARR